MAGGGGTRLWPLSREELPKQFLCLQGDESLLQMTVSRLLGLVEPGRLSVVANSRWEALIRHQVGEVTGVDDLLVVEEPCGRNTGPAIALGLAALREAGASDEDFVLVCPSDQVIKNQYRFLSAVKAGFEPASRGFLVTFGVVPDRPDTGFGYVCAGEDMGGWLKSGGFVEKPDLETALRYLELGNYYWNAGIFLFRLRDMEEALGVYEKEIAGWMKRGYGAMFEEFERLPSVPIDVAVFERAPNVAVVPMDAKWSDLGSWDALWATFDKDDFGNVTRGDVATFGCCNSLVHGSDRFVAVIDVEDLLVVDSPDALLISRRNSSQKVREVVGMLAERRRKELVQANFIVRPWGSYRIITDRFDFKVKHIVVAPGKRLSLQYHEKRSEHWVVLSGEALVRVGDKEVVLLAGQSTFIPKGEVHRVSNVGDVSLEFVEIQQGEYLGEDDIVRLEDDFRRG